MHHARRRRAAAGLLCFMLTAGLAAAEELPRVRLVATGGTISNRAGGRLTADDLLALVPDARRYARTESEQFSNLPSSALTLKQWLALSRPMVRELPEGGFGLHYDPAIAVPFRAITPELAAAGEALLWQSYERVRVR